MSSIEVFNNSDCNGSASPPPTDFDCGSIPFGDISLHVDKYCKEGYDRYENAGVFNVGYNDAFSSIHIPSGMSAMVFSDSNQQGQSRCIQWDYWDLSADTWSNGAMDNSISSVEVFNNGNCESDSTPPPRL